MKEGFISNGKCQHLNLPDVTQAIKQGKGDGAKWQCACGAVFMLTETTNYEQWGHEASFPKYYWTRLK